MSAGIPSGGNNSQDFELNLASIIDCFTVLIAFMLVSASFLSIGILDAGIAASADAAASTTPPPVNFAVELGKGQNMEIKVTGQVVKTIHVSAASSTGGIFTGLSGNTGSWDYSGLTTQLEELHKQWPTVGAITLSADNSIEYKDVIKAMDITRKTIPAVLLGGF